MSVGCLLVLAGLIWHFALASRWTDRLRADWKWETHYVGAATFRQPGAANLPAKDSAVVYERASWVEREITPSREVLVRDRYTAVDAATGNKAMEVLSSARVDPKTGTHAAPEYRGDIYVFPRMVQKRTYSLRNNYLNGVKVSFQKEVDLYGLNTFLFSYRGRGEYTQAYAGSARNLGIKIEPGQEIRCADDQFSLNIWVEPETGEIVRIAEACPAGDYLYARGSSQPLAPLARWETITTGDTATRLSERVRAERARYRAAAYGGSLAIAAGVACMALAYPFSRVGRNK